MMIEKEYDEQASTMKGLIIGVSAGLVIWILVLLAWRYL